MYTQLPNEGQPMIQPVQQIQPVLAVQGGYPAYQYVFVADPLQELANSTGAIIRQEPESFEMYSGCDQPNRYHVYAQTIMGLKYLFKCRESSGCCARCCCTASNRGYDMDIKHITNQSEFTSDIAPNFIRIHKPCSWCPCCRPTMDVIQESTGTKFFICQRTFLFLCSRN